MTHRWRYLGLVWLGGALGTALRALLGWAMPAGWVSWPTLLVNVLGAAVIGAFYEYLALASVDGRPRRGVRLFVGTGVLGGFTTYSAFALLTERSGWAGAAYAGVTVALGLLACWLGLQAGAALYRRGATPTPEAHPADER